MVRRLAINFSEVLLCLPPLFSLALWKKHATRHPSPAWHWRSSGLHVYPSSRSCCCECQDWLQYYRELSAGHFAEPRVCLLSWVKAWSLRMDSDWWHEATSCSTNRFSVFLQFAFPDFHWWRHGLSLMGGKIQHLKCKTFINWNINLIDSWPFCLLYLYLHCDIFFLMFFKKFDRKTTLSHKRW